MLEVIRHAVAPSRERVIVDIGCGTGGNIAALAQEYSCIGIDESLEAIRLAEARFPSVRFLHGSWLHALDQIRHEAAAVFLLMDVMEHVEDDFWFFSNLMAKIPVGGYLLATVPAGSSLWSPHDVAFGHWRRYEPERLSEVWKGLPVSVRLFSYYNSLLYPAIKALRLWNQFRDRALGDSGTDFKTFPAPINEMLEKIMGSEAAVLVELLDGKRRRGFSRGVSLIALLRREPGSLQPRRRPTHIPMDRHRVEEETHAH